MRDSEPERSGRPEGQGPGPHAAGQHPAGPHGSGPGARDAYGPGAQEARTQEARAQEPGAHEPDHHDPDPHDPATYELRVLLERAVPQLPAPAQRLERVRQRVRRRARRRTAGLSVAAVLAIAAAGLLMPGLGGTPGDPAPHAATSLAPPASGSVPTTTGQVPMEPLTPTATYQPHSFPALTGLRLRLPQDWSVLEPAGSGTDYFSSQRLGLPEDGCAHPLDDFCTPLVQTLARGGSLTMLELSHNRGMADKIRLYGWGVSQTPVVSSCRTVGGTTQLSAVLVDGTGSDVVITVTACLNHPTDAQQAQLRDILTTVDFT